MNIFLILEAVLATICAGVWSALWFSLRRENRWLARDLSNTVESVGIQRRLLTSSQRELAEQKIVNDGLQAMLRFSESTNATLAHELLKARASVQIADDFIAAREAEQARLHEPLTRIDLEVFLAKMQGSQAYRLPEGLDLLADEVGNLLYLPGPKSEYPRRAFVYICTKDAGKSVSRKELHSGQAPEIQHQRVTFVLDDWLTVGEVTNKLHRAAESLLKATNTIVRISG